MKKIFVIASLFAAISVAAITPPDVNEKVLKAFNETFVKAKDVVWHEMDNTFQASFKQSQIVTRATYDKEGNLLSTTRYYQEDELPAYILSKLKKKYVGKSVFGVTESTIGDQVSFYITLQDAKTWYVVKADVWGNFDLTKKYKKA